MTRKKMITEVGRSLRKATGMPFPVAMNLARRVTGRQSTSPRDWRTNGLFLDLANDRVAEAKLAAVGCKLETFSEGEGEYFALYCRVTGPRGSVERSITPL
jgi:hypothetical protein